MARDVLSAPRREPQRGATQSISFMQVDLRKAVRTGVLGGAAAIFIASVGMIEAFDQRIIIQPVISLSYIALFLVAVVAGSVASKTPAAIEGVEQLPPGRRNVLGGLLSGVLGGLVLGVFVIVSHQVNLRNVFIAISPRMLSIITFDQGPWIGSLVLLAGSTVIGTLAGTAHLVSDRWRGPLFAAIGWTLIVSLLELIIQPLLEAIGLAAVSSFLYSPLGGVKPWSGFALFGFIFAVYSLNAHKGFSIRERYEELPQNRQQPVMLGMVVVLALGVLMMNLFGGVFVSEVLDVVGIFLLMGLGLNIVVGFAGLLDLGYVAFFAVGAYVTAVLTSPSSPAISPEFTFWLALPFVVLAAALAGILVGTPVLRMRGDYLAIVTLGFGEIARLLAVSEWLFPYVGGAQGILSIPKIQVGEFVAQTPPELFYPLVAFVLLAIYITYALKNSRIGRAWMAMREDEPVAEVMGIDIVQAKLSAFIVGAIIASFGGAIFATKLGSIFPHSFNVVVSIQVLVLIILGGMGSIPGVIVGAFVVIGLPEFLREFSEFKFLLYGALLIYMMLNKPEGFVPTRERMRELHQDEMSQDAWLAHEEAEARERAADAAVSRAD